MRKSVTDLDKWAVFFQYASDPIYREIVNEVIASEEVLQMTGNLLMSISQDEVERARFRSRRKFQTDLQSDLATAKDNGRVEGRVEEKITIARNLLKLNVPIEQIASATGMTRTEIENLQ